MAVLDVIQFFIVCAQEVGVIGLLHFPRVPIRKRAVSEASPATVRRRVLRFYSLAGYMTEEGRQNRHASNNHSYCLLRYPAIV